MSPFADITANRGPSLATIKGTSPAGEAWLQDNVGKPDGWPGGLPVYYAEHRYAPDLLLGAHTAGLTVCLDGRIADAPRD